MAGDTAESGPSNSSGGLGCHVVLEDGDENPVSKCTAGELVLSVCIAMGLNLMSCTFKSSELASCEDLGLWQGQGLGGSERRFRYLASSNANNCGAKPSKICNVSLVAGAGH